MTEQKINLAITQDERQPLLDRRLITATCTTESTTPSKALLRKALAKAAGAPQDLVVIRSVHTSYGTNQALITACVYEKKESLQQIELAHLQKRNQKEEPKQEQTQEKTEEKAEQAESKDQGGEETAQGEDSAASDAKTE
ncbi:hypothetical protein D6783_03510 [Candidatus Woesearchaeota archaeon]|nr:MAG: hypothetical protein D6783_03510 [Candidatus Woesearchaeota archaeon]